MSKFSLFPLLFLFHTLSLGKITHSHLSVTTYVLMASLFLSLVLTSFLSSRLELSIAH